MIVLTLDELLIILCLDSYVEKTISDHAVYHRRSAPAIERNLFREDVFPEGMFLSSDESGSGPVANLYFVRRDGRRDEIIYE
jgi:hypothetical protein